MKKLSEDANVVILTCNSDSLFASMFVLDNIKRRFEMCDALVDDNDKLQMKSDIVYSELFAIALSMSMSLYKDEKAGVHADPILVKTLDTIIDAYDNGDNRSKLFEYLYERDISIF